MPQITHIDKEFKMNFDQILDKPFLVTTINWTTAAANFTELWRLPFPSSIMSNPLARVPFESAVFYQARMCCMLQVSGTPMHQGLLLVAAVPHGTPKIENANQILSAPHVFLNATESTSVCLECPMYTPSSLYRTNAANAGVNNRAMNTNLNGSDLFDLVFFVMDSLSVASGSATTISISVHNIFKEAEFYVPKVGAMTWQAQCGVDRLWACKAKSSFSTKCACGEKELSSDCKHEPYESESLVNNLWRLPTKILDNVSTGLKVVAGDLIDYGRGMVKNLTGFHNPNVATIDNRMIATFRNFPNNVDQPVRMEVMDNHAQFSRIYDDYYFRTEQDEMDLKFLTSKPVFVGKFKVSSSDPTGKNLFAYPMTPMVEADITAQTGSSVFYSPLRTIYEASRFWRGDLKLHIQAVCTNFHFCKIIIVKNYAMTDGPINALSAVVPSYSNIHNINTDTLEFSAGGQIQTVDLKYNSNLRQIECTKDYTYNAISHGLVYGYLVQPLTYNSNVPTSITFNVYISGGDNLQFSGYALDSINIAPGVAPVYPGVPNYFSDELGVYEVLKDGSHTGRIVKKEDAKDVDLEKRRYNFLTNKPDFYTVEDGDSWSDISYVTSTPIDKLRALNSTIYNSSTKGYDVKKGPILKKGDKIKIVKCWTENTTEIPESCFKAETMERAEGINTIINTNDQDPLLNKKEPIDENICMSFRPNTSIRDYLRFMYPQETYVTTPSRIRNVASFDLSKFIKKFDNADYFQALQSLYMGMSGGLKLKFKISGVSCASAYFVPPSSYCINGSYLAVFPMSNAVPTDVNSLINFLEGASYNPTVKSYTPPQIEMQDYTRPYHGGGSQITGRPGSTFVLEMVIPNMNPFNFVGNSTKWRNTGSDVENDLGVVYINYEAGFDGVSYSEVNIIPFVGLNDEARLGFQVYAPKKVLPTYASTTPTAVCRSSILHPPTVAGTYPNGIPIFPMPLIGSSYYFKAT